MSLDRRLAVLLCLGVLCILSCRGQEMVQTAQLVDQKVTEVSKDGKQVKVNMGSFDKIHAGERLYVTRNNKLVGFLMVSKPTDYSSDCFVIASHKDAVTPGQNIAALQDLRVGDLVAREFKDITRPGMPMEKVPRMVPVPYEPPKTQIEANTGKSGELGSKVPTKVIELPMIPRDQVDQWIKDHPLTNPRTKP